METTRTLPRYAAEVVAYFNEKTGRGMWRRIDYVRRAFCAACDTLIAFHPADVPGAKCGKAGEPYTGIACPKCGGAVVRSTKDRQTSDYVAIIPAAR